LAKLLRLIAVVGMLGFEHLLEDCQGALVEWPRRRKVALVPKQDGEVVEVRRRTRMLGTEQLLADRQRALEELSCICRVALFLEHPTEVAKTPYRIGMLNTGPVARLRIAALTLSARRSVRTSSIKVGEPARPQMAWTSRTA
jgi:hypothetical protein